MIKKKKKSEEMNKIIYACNAGIGVIRHRAENDYNLDTREYWHNKFQQRKHKSNINFRIE